MGGFFHKTPSRLASSLVSLGIFLLSGGLAMYALAKSIIRARAQQCERVLQVVVDLAEASNDIHGQPQIPNGDQMTGIVDAPPPYEAPPPYPGQQDNASGNQPVDQVQGVTVDARADDCSDALVSNESTCSNSDSPGSADNQSAKTPEEHDIDLPVQSLPPTYSRIDNTINIPDSVDDHMGRGELPPAYSEFP